MEVHMLICFCRSFLSMKGRLTMWDKQTRSIALRYYLFHLLAGMMFVSAFLRPFYVEWGHLTDSEVLYLQSVYLVASFLSQVPTGIFADRFGRKKSLLLGMGFSAVGVLTYGAAPIYSLFVTGEILVAIGGGFLTGADKALVLAYLEKVGRTDSYRSIVNNVSIFRRVAGSIGAGLAAVLIPLVGLNGLMLVTAVPYTLAFLVAIGFPEPASQCINRKSVLKLAYDGYWYVRHHRCVRRIVLNMFVSVPTGYYLLWTYQPYLEQLHTPRYAYTIVYVIVSWSQVAAVLLSGRLIRMLGERRYFLFTALIPGVSSGK